MKIINSIKKGFTDFTKGSKILYHAFRGGGDLVSMSKVVEGLIPTYGKNVVRQQVIKAIEGDIKKALKQGDDAVDKLMDKALACPEYMKLLRRLNMDESNVRALVFMVKKEVEAKR